MAWRQCDFKGRWSLISIYLKYKWIDEYILRVIIALTLIILEALLFLYCKDGTGIFTHSVGMTIAEYMRTHGGLQFALSAYIQKIVFICVLSYPVLVITLWTKESNRFKELVLNTVNPFKFSYCILAINAICFFVLLLFFLIVRNPIHLIENPLSFEALFYTFIPIVWVCYLYSVIDLFFPIIVLRKLLRNNILLALALLFLTAVSTNPGINPLHFEGLLQFWSNLLLEPTIKLASLISYIFGFPAHIFSFPGAPFPDFGTEKFHTGISPDCSGYEGITLISVLLLGYWYSQRLTLRLQRSVFILPFAILFMFFLNSMRIVILIAIGHFYSPELAFNGFHSVGGWLNLLIVLILSLWALNQFQIFQKQGKPNTSISRGMSHTVFLFPLIALIASSLLTKVFFPDFQWLYPIPIAIASVIMFFIKDTLRPALICPSIFSVVVGILVFALWITLIPVDGSQSLHFLEQIQTVPIWISLVWLLCRIIGASIIVPIAEELAFRGFMLPSLEGFLNGILNNITLTKYRSRNIKMLCTFLSLTSTSLLFGLLHSDILAASVAGLFYGLVYLKRRSLMDAITAHAVTNVLLAIDVIYFGNWSYW